jgi:hypothetical protein
MTTLTEAFKKVRADDTLAKEFTEDPAGVMQRLGVDTSKLKVTKGLPPPSHGGRGVAASADVCVSIGCIVCGSVG